MSDRDENGPRRGESDRDGGESGRGDGEDDAGERDGSSDDEIRESLDRAASGAPAAGWAVRDRFSSDEIFERVLASADEEIAAGKKRLFFSGLTAGFAIVLTFLGHSVGAAAFPDNRFLAAVLYPIGFLYIILGHYQLFTENTLPPVALVLSRLASFPLLMRVWVVVLIANVVGAGLGTYLLANTHTLSPEAIQAGMGFTEVGLEHGWWTVFTRALFAGWLVAGVVWLDHAARDTVARFFIIYTIFYLISAAHLYHVVTAAAEVFFYLFVNESASFAVFYEFWLPVLLGNTVGGVFLFTLVNYAQTEQHRFPEVRVLDKWDLFFSWRGGTETPPSPRVETGDDSGTDEARTDGSEGDESEADEARTDGSETE